MRTEGRGGRTMTDLHAGYVVTLSEDLREDDATDIITAISLIRGVQTVTPILGGIERQVAEMRAKKKILDRLYDVLQEIAGS